MPDKEAHRAAAVDLGAEYWNTACRSSRDARESCLHPLTEQQNGRRLALKQLVLLLILSMPWFCRADERGVAGLTAHDMVDNREALELSPRLSHRLLSNMREQLAATRAIIGYLAQENFDRAASTARTKLGMTDDLKLVYDSTESADFRKLAMEATSSSTELVHALQSKEIQASLLALRETMSHCIQCHNRFKD